MEYWELEGKENTELIAEKAVVVKIISGGQTGADKGALIGASAAGIETGGYAPKGYRTENGRDNSLSGYGLIELIGVDYNARRIENIKAADGTVILADDERSPGTKATVRDCKKAGKPYTINPPEPYFRKWLRVHHVAVLNVAGNRESVAPGIEERTAQFIRATCVAPDRATPREKRTVEDIVREVHAPQTLPPSPAPVKAPARKYRISVPYYIHNCKTGFNVPNLVYVGRTKKYDNVYQNPFSVKDLGGLDPCLERFWNHARKNNTLKHALPNLIGKTLGCWCAPAPCHADLLAFMARVHWQGEDRYEMFCSLGWSEVRLVVYGTTEPLTEKTEVDRDFGRLIPRNTL